MHLTSFNTAGRSAQRSPASATVRATNYLLTNSRNLSWQSYVDPDSSQRGALTIHSNCVRGTLSGVASSCRDPSGNVDSPWIRIQSKGWSCSLDPSLAYELYNFVANRGRRSPDPTATTTWRASKGRFCIERSWCRCVAAWKANARSTCVVAGLIECCRDLNLCCLWTSESCDLKFRESGSGQHKVKSLRDWCAEVSEKVEMSCREIGGVYGRVAAWRRYDGSTSRRNENVIST